MAVELRQAGVVEEGLEVYRTLIQAMVDEQQRQLELNGAPLDPHSSLGREWEQLIRDLHAVIDRVAASNSVLLWIDTVSWLCDVSRLVASRGLVGGFATTLSLIESAWRQELSAPSASSGTRQDALLLRLYELSSTPLDMAFSSDAIVAQARIAYVRSFTNVIKTAIDLESDEAAAVATEYFLQSGEPREGRLDDCKVASLLSLYGWMLHRFDHRLSDRDFPETRVRIDSALAGQDGLLEVLSNIDALMSSLGVNWWELNKRGPVSGGVMRMGDYATLAAALSVGSGILRRATDDIGESSLNALRSLDRVVDQWREGKYPGAKRIVGDRDRHLAELSGQLRAALTIEEVERERAYARMPLNGLRKDAFVNAARSALTEARPSSLVSLLSGKRSGGVWKTGADEGHPSQGDEHNQRLSPNFGLVRMLPRTFFLSTEVIADPESLAVDFVAALVDGEENQVLMQLSPRLPARPVLELTSVLSVVTVAAARTDDLARVIVTNSMQARAQLVANRLLAEDPELTTFAGVPLKLVHDDGQPFIAVLTAASGPEATLAPLSAVDAGGIVFDDIRVLIDVAEVSAGDIDALIADGDYSPLDEARMRGSVRVKLLEHLVVSAFDESSDQLWRLPDGTW